MKNLQQNGDLIERYFFAFIEQHLPTYIKLWEEFISQPDESLNTEKKRKKLRLSQLLYTCLDGVVSVKPIKVRHESGVYLPDLKDTNFIPAYYDLMNDIFLFQAHIGRVSEIVRKEIPSILKGMNGKELLQEYFDARNNIIHSQRIPFSIEEDGILAIPKFEGQNQSESWKHYGNMIWSDVNPNRFQFLSDYIVSTFDNFMKDLEQVFKIILGKTKNIFPEIYSTNTLVDPISEQPILFLSGSTEDPSIKQGSSQMAPKSNHIKPTFKHTERRKK